jgi:hypothetical protein
MVVLFRGMQCKACKYILLYAYEYRTVILLTTAQNQYFNYLEAGVFLQSFIILLSMRPMWIDGNNQISIHTPNLQLCPLMISFTQTNLQISGFTVDHNVCIIIISSNEEKTDGDYIKLKMRLHNLLQIDKVSVYHRLYYCFIIKTPIVPILPIVKTDCTTFYKIA